MTLEELLADAQLTDDTELDFGGKGKFKVGDFRAYDRKRAEKVSAEEKRVAKELAAIAAKQTELNDLSTQAATLMEKLKAEQSTVTPSGDIDFETDPLYSPLVKKLLKPMQAKQGEIENAIKNLNGTIAESGKFLLHEYYDRRWRDIPAEKRGDKSWKDYLKVAAEKKYLNEFNLPDPVEAFNREVEPMEKDTLAKENAALKLQLEQMTKNASAPRMPRPGAAGTPPGQGKDAKKFDSVDDLIDAAFADPTIQEAAGRA